jgi:hypothetical protein
MVGLAVVADQVLLAVLDFLGKVILVELDLTHFQTFRLAVAVAEVLSVAMQLLALQVLAVQVRQTL